MKRPNKIAHASSESLHRIFTVPEASHSTLGKIEQAISENLNRFLQEHIAASDSSLEAIEKDFSQAQIPHSPTFVSEHTEFLLEKLVARSVHTSSPSFIGHMTSALPYFLMPLSKIMIALNQNTVKIETSKAFTPLERQVLGMLHHLIYEESETFYHEWMHNAEHSLGTFCSGGTIANITALWVARNNALKADGQFKGVAQEGLFRAMQHYGYHDLVILVSNRGHYSLKKAADVLGIGQQNLVAIQTDENDRISIPDLEQTLLSLKQKQIKPFAIVGVAGSTETGSIDPLNTLADIAEREHIHFHVDAAWGGATLMSNVHRTKFVGIERADSVTVDAHKQFYIPMGAGMVLFKSPASANSIKHHANYILRKGSKDLGSHTFEGSRGGIAMLLFSSFNIIGKTGYQLLIDQSISRAKYFAKLIKSLDNFELITEPELCILTYRYVPNMFKETFDKADQITRKKIHIWLNELTISIQKYQREAGQSFVSRTQLMPYRYNKWDTHVFRVVLANPLTTQDILKNIIHEQKMIAEEKLKATYSFHQQFIRV